MGLRCCGAASARGMSGRTAARRQATDRRRCRSPRPAAARRQRSSSARVEGRPLQRSDRGRADPAGNRLSHAGRGGSRWNESDHAEIWPGNAQPPTTAGGGNRRAGRLDRLRNAAAKCRRPGQQGPHRQPHRQSSIGQIATRRPQPFIEPTGEIRSNENPPSLSAPPREPMVSICSDETPVQDGRVAACCRRARKSRCVAR